MSLRNSMGRGAVGLFGDDTARIRLRVVGILAILSPKVTLRGVVGLLATISPKTRLRVVEFLYSVASSPKSPTTPLPIEFLSDISVENSLIAVYKISSLTVYKPVLHIPDAGGGGRGEGAVSGEADWDSN